MANRRRVYLARHGEVSYFEPGQDLGTDDPPLNADGVAQAEALGRVLRDAPMDLAICTGLRRTRQTAELVIGARHVPIERIDGFSEAQTGTFEGIDSPEAMETAFVRTFEAAERPDARFLTGELYVHLWERVSTAWSSLLARDDWQSALVAAHGVVNRTILAQALGAGPEIYRRIEQDAGCLNVIDIDGAGADARVAYVRLMNFTPYNLIKDGLHETTLEMLWRRFVGS